MQVKEAGGSMRHADNVYHRHTWNAV